MEFITSRGYELPCRFEQMEQGLWFNMWKRKLWPYLELNPNDTLYWYETVCSCIVWKTVVIEVMRFSYENKDKAFRELRNKFGPFDENFPYCLNAPNSGYCLAYAIKPVKRLNLPKPDGLRFPRIGWSPINSYISCNWLGLGYHLNAAI